MTTRTLQLLMALADGPLHGYGIRRAVEERTEGAVVLGSGTLYEAIQRLEGDRWIEEVTAPPGEEGSGGPPRRFYALTAPGRAALSDELRRLEGIVRWARTRNLLPEP